MRIKSILPMLILTVATFGFSINSSQAANVDVNINGFVPAPPGVFVRVDAGRPYYVEHDRRVYMERRPDKHHKHFKEKRHHDNGNHYGNDKHDERGGHGH